MRRFSSTFEDRVASGSFTPICFRMRPNNGNTRIFMWISQKRARMPRSDWPSSHLPSTTSHQVSRFAKSASQSGVLDCPDRIQRRFSSSNTDSLLLCRSTDRFVSRDGMGGTSAVDRCRVHEAWLGISTPRISSCPAYRRHTLRWSPCIAPRRVA